MTTMRRLFWLGLGIVLGALVVHRVNRVVRNLGPAGITENLGSTWAGLRDLADTVREGMNEREAELREALAVDAEHREP
jgi:Family of unknown function (DUF6167)